MRRPMMSERNPPDMLARQAAIDPNRSFIVQAPAGSGKTSLLTDRILALLARVQEPEQLVAMTFTRKAAAEMHSRVLEKLERAASLDPPSEPYERAGWVLARAVLERDQALGWGLLEHPARLRIQTIDSFCASLVRAMPWLTGLGGMPRIVDDAPALHQEAARRTVQAAGEHDCVRRLLIHLDLAVESVVQALTDMLGKRDHWLPLLKQGEDVSQLQVFLEQTIAAELDCVAQSMPVGWQSVLAEPARLAAQALIEDGKHEHPVTALLDWQAGQLQADPSDLPRWRALAALLLTQDGTTRKSLTKNIGCPPGSQQKETLSGWLDSMSVDDQAMAWVSNLAAVPGMPDPELSEAQWEILTAQLQCLRLAAANLLLVFAERGEVDFIEVTQRAVQALGDSDDPSDLLLKLDNRIAHVLVDEFQDTSSMQLNLLRLLTSGWQAGDGRTLFLVGDPMQSIYRFRKAEVGLFLQVQARGIGDVALEPLTLTSNFRSQAGLVDWVNATFAPLFPAMNHSEFGAIRYEPADAWHALASHEAVTWHLEQEDDAAWARVVEIASQAWTRHGESDKPMAILVRSRAHLGEVARELAKANLPCRAIELDSLASRTVVVDLLQLTRALVHRGDRAAWLGVLRAPWCGLTTGTLLRLFGHSQQAVCDVLADCLSSAHARPEIEADQWARLQGVAGILLDGLRNDNALPLVARLEIVWRALEGHRLVTAATDLEDAQSYLRLVQRLSDYSQIDLDELERQLAKLYAEPQGAGRAIEVMTMHKAKGLEFEAVVLLGLERKPRADTSPLVRIEQQDQRVLFGPVKARIEQEQDSLSRYLAQREAMRQAFEVDRLLYVAATRARSSLHLVAVCSVNPKTGDWADPVKSSLLWRLWRFRPAMAAPAIQCDAAQQTAAQPWWQAPPMLRRPEPIAASQSLSRLAGASSAVAAGGKRSGDRFAWPVAETSERISGVLIHAWLARYAERASTHSDHRVPELDLLQRQLRALGLPGPLRADAAREVAAALLAMLASQRGQWLLSQPLRRVEWALMDARQTISIMDLAIDLPDRWLVVDYKTTRPAANESEAEFAARMIARYGGQMARYQEQLQLLDGRAAQAVLYFPRDDRWIEVD